MLTKGFLVTKSIDFSAKDDYTRVSIEQVLFEIGLPRGIRSIQLTINDVQMQDALIDPFKSGMEQISFLTFKDNKLDEVIFSHIDFYEIKFLIDPSVRTVTRTRYNFWKALGDIGGFHDGLKLLVTSLLSPLGHLIFYFDITRGGLFKAKKS